MASPKVKLASAGVRALLHDPGVTAHLRARAERVAAAGRASAPVETGAYRDGITVFEHDTGSRTVVRVGSTVRYAPLVEAKTGNMARALDAAGGA